MTTWQDAWPPTELETLAHCPLCGGAHAVLAAANVRDFAFKSAPGAWDYWRCANCQGLFLKVRPTFAHIGKAYSSYYTHSNAAAPGLASKFKTRLRHEAWAIGYQASIEPRLHLPAFLHKLAARLAKRAYPGFIISALATLPRGKLLDVGAGNGRYLGIAEQQGFAAQGIDPDPAAVAAMRGLGLNASVGGFESLAELPADFDVVVASHVLEHAHSPMPALQALLQRLKPGGALLLALPNAQSPVFDAFGVHWRGLEAPRHIAIPARDFLLTWLQSQGHAASEAPIRRAYTWAESAAIAAENSATAPTQLPSLLDQPDITELVAIRRK